MRNRNAVLDIKIHKNRRKLAEISAVSELPKNSGTSYNVVCWKFKSVGGS